MLSLEPSQAKQSPVRRAFYRGRDCFTPFSLFKGCGYIRPTLRIAQELQQVDIHLSGGKIKKMNNLIIKAFGGLFFLVLVLAVALFLPAGTLSYWQAWVFLALWTVSVGAITLYLMKRDPGLLERRVAAGPVAEQEKSQKLIQGLASLAFIVMFVVPALDHRFGWSTVPLVVVIAGDILVVFGLYSVFLVFKENTFTSAVIAVGDEQKIVSTGPYAIVRHPMYAGAFIMLLGVPLSLGSWWGLLPIVPMISVIVWRLLEEEKFLLKNLDGYAGYRNKVKYRLIPFIW